MFKKIKIYLFILLLALTNAHSISQSQVEFYKQDVLNGNIKGLYKRFGLKENGKEKKSLLEKSRDIIKFSTNSNTQTIENIAAKTIYPDNQTLLHFALSRKESGYGSDKKIDYKMVKLLVSQGADLNIINAHGETPLYLAVKNGHAKTVKYLLEQGADPNIINPSIPRYPLLLGVENIDKSPLKRTEYTEIAKALLQHKANPNIAEDSLNNQFSPLHYAIQSNSLELLKELLQNGANPNAQSSFGQTPLHLATNRRVDIEFMKELLKYGADKTIKDKLGFNPITMAADDNNFQKFNLMNEFKNSNEDTEEQALPLYNKLLKVFGRIKNPQISTSRCY